MTIMRAIIYDFHMYGSTNGNVRIHKKGRRFLFFENQNK